MVHAKNYETVSTFVTVMRKKNCGLFPDTVYSTAFLLFVIYIYIDIDTQNILKVNKDRQGRLHCMLGSRNSPVIQF